jgi:hypothetical protein
MVNFTLDRFTPEEKAPGTHWIGDWVGPRDCLDAVENRKILPLPGIELRLSNTHPVTIPTELSGLHSIKRRDWMLCFTGKNKSTI